MIFRPRRHEEPLMRMKVYKTFYRDLTTFVHDFDEIPDHPSRSDAWMLDHRVALWFSTLDNRWRFLLPEIALSTRRSVESFASKQEAAEFYRARKMPTWTSTRLSEEVR